MQIAGSGQLKTQTMLHLLTSSQELSRKDCLLSAPQLLSVWESSPGIPEPAAAGDIRNKDRLAPQASTRLKPTN